MLINRITGGCLAAVSFIMLGMLMSSLSASGGGIGIQIMDRMGLPFVLVFIAAQAVVLFILVAPAERLTPALLFVGGAIVYMVVLATKGSGISLLYSLYAGSAFSGLSTGTLVMMGGKK